MTGIAEFDGNGNRMQSYNLLVAACTKAAVSAVAAGSRSRLMAGDCERADRPALRFRCYPEGDRDRHREVGKLADQVSGPLRVLVESRREQVMAIAARHHASRVRLFGSAARGEDKPDSDIDLLVDFDQDSSLFDLIRMSRELEALLGRTVDVVSAGGLKSRDRAILAESVDL